MSQSYASCRKHYLILAGLLTLCVTVSCHKKKEEPMQCLYIVEHIKTTTTNQKNEYVKKLYYAEKYSIIDDSSKIYKVLIDLVKEKVFFIDDKNKQYRMLTLHQFRQLARSNPAHVTNDDVEIKQTLHTKTIDSHICKKYIMNIPELGLNSSLWISNKINAPLELFYTFAYKSKIGNEMTKLITIMRKTGGYPILHETSSAKMPDFYTRIMTVEIAEVTRDETFFSVPPGYTRAAFTDH